MTMNASEVYDRQIRLWGLEAQKRMQEARVLFCGLRALGAEICKNVVLAGINVTLMDAETVKPEDLGAQFFLRPEHVGMNRAEACLPGVQAMNPLASVACHPSDPSAYPDSFFVNFDVIVGTDLTPAQMRRLDTLARQRGKEGGREGGGFICAVTFGLHAWAFIDLGESFTGRMDEAPGGGRTEGKNGEGGKAKPMPPREFTLAYPSLSDALAVPWSALKSRFPVPRVFVMARLLGLYEENHGDPFPPNAREESVEVFVSESQLAMGANGLEAGFLSEEELRALAGQSQSELSPVCAVVGGILGQEILKAISRKGEPALNVFLWDGATHEGRVIAVPPPKEKE